MSRGERGVVAGLDGLVFGMLVMVAGTLLIVNAWAVVDSRTALDGAAREYLRSYTRAGDPGTARSSGAAAVTAFLAGRGMDPAAVRTAHPDPTTFGPCAAATVELSLVVPVARVPFVGGFGSTTVHVTGTELVDAHREVIPGAAFDPDSTECAG